MTFRRLHLLVGLATVVLFGLTGLYLRFRYDDLRGMTDATRLLFRSTQTYLLLSGLLNVAMGLNGAGESGKERERTGGSGREGEMLRREELRRDCCGASGPS